MGIQTELKCFQAEFNQTLANTFEQISDKTAPKLHQAMKYSVSNGGKRLRPFLLQIMANVLAVDPKLIKPAAVAIECIHSYSLVHDDLPAMDDDDLRRGKATCHIKFDEAHAILAGDALQTLAFELLANANVAAEIKLSWITILTKASGYQGMCGGQSLDLEAENKAVDLDALANIHSLKTGALLKAAVSMGCAAQPELDDEQKQKFERFAELIGLAFQIQDDILDVTATTDALGKPQGSDQKLNKSTYPGLLGLAGAEHKAEQVFQSALEQIEDLPYNTQPLMDFAQFIIKRQH